MFDARLLSGLSVMMAVVEAGSFVQAVDALGLSPSGVSRAIARLETRIGIRLFDRNSTRRGHSPRKAGVSMPRRQPLLTGIEEAAEDAAGASATVRGRIKLNLDPWFARIVLAPRLPELTTRYPQLSLELLVSNHREDMMAGGVDLALRFGPPHAISADRAKDPRNAHHNLCVSALSRAPRDAQESRKTSQITIASAVPRPATGRPFTWEFHRRENVVEIPVNGRIVMDDPSTALAACEAGQGLFPELRTRPRPVARERKARAGPARMV